MYAIVREGDGRFYTSMVFGNYQIEGASARKRDCWIVLNREKTALVKQYHLQQDTKHLIPMVLITDADRSDWAELSEGERSVGVLPTDRLPAMVEQGAVPAVLTRKCVELDRAYRYEELREVKTEEDIRDLKWVSGCFHDSVVAEAKEDADGLSVRFEGVWGCTIEVRFEGEVCYHIPVIDPWEGDPVWYDCTLVFRDGFVWLIDREGVSVENIPPHAHWFRAKTMKYRVIPD